MMILWERPSFDHTIFPFEFGLTDGREQILEVEGLNSDPLQARNDSDRRSVRSKGESSFPDRGRLGLLNAMDRVKFYWSQ